MAISIGSIVIILSGGVLAPVPMFKIFLISGRLVILPGRFAIKKGITIKKTYLEKRKRIDKK